MSDPLRASYDAVPYRHGAVTESHPGRLGAVARLLGVAAAPPDGCRVLELGCAEGLNLLPWAERFPRSEFTGVDFSAVHIATGEAARTACGLANVRLLAADLREFEPEPGAFDYVIAHGVYSWTPDEVKDRLLAICARALAPEGVAYVSYNVHPTGGLLGGLRAILRAELERTGGVTPENAARLLRVLGQSFAAEPGPYAALVREFLAEMQRKPIALALHDELGAVNDPVTFLDFTAHAGRHGLQFLAEAHYAAMPFEHLRPAARQPLAELAPDPLRAQQFMDLLGQRRIRNSLLIHAAHRPPGDPDPAVIRDCAIGFHMFPPDGQINLAPGAALRLTGRHEFAMTVEKPAQKAFFAALCEAAPGRIHYAEARGRAAELLAIGGLPDPLDDALLCAGLFKLFAVDQVDLLLAGDGAWLHPAPPPQPSSLMRHQARHGLPVSNRWHENVELSPEELRWLAGESATVNEAALLRTGLVG